MATVEDVQAYLERLDSGVSAEEVEPGLWVLSSEDGGSQIVVNFTPPVVVLRVNVMELPKDDSQRSALMDEVARAQCEGAASWVVRYRRITSRADGRSADRESGFYRTPGER